MKKIIYTLILSLVTVSAVVFAKRDSKIETPQRAAQKPITEAERKAVLKNWEASPDGIAFRNWKASAAGKKVLTASAKIQKSTKDFSSMEGVITSLSLPAGSRLGFGLMVKINGEDYILAFGTEKSVENLINFKNDLSYLRNLKVNDKITIRSHSVSMAPKYAYPILAGDYIERNNKLVYMRPSSGKGGC